MPFDQIRGERRVNGQGIDAARERRPGVPMARSPAPDAGAHWTAPPRQAGGAAAMAHLAHRPTPVFGTAVPPRGASGLLRRLAYRVPEYRATRWALLLGADRLDVLEHRLRRGWLALPAAAALAAGYWAVSRALRD